MSENNTVTRRDFLKLGTNILKVAMLPPWFREILFNRMAIGDFYTTKKNDLSAVNKELTFALPEKLTRDRQWEQITTPESPPAGYRQAAVWHSGRKSFVIHGGWGAEGNMDQTWEFKDNKWSLLEEGSVKLSGHKMVETPLGVFTYGGVVDKGNGQWGISNKGYLFNESGSNCSWEEISFDQINGELPEVRQGFGMQYDKNSNSIWIIGGAGTGITESIGWIKLPDGNINTWRYQRVRQMTSSIPRTFEPLVFAIDDKEPVYMCGGLAVNGDVTANTADVYKIGHHVSIYNEIIADIDRVDWPATDYGGPVRGGYDSNRGQLVLNGGQTPTFFTQPWMESVEYNFESNEWMTIQSNQNPCFVDKPASALDPAAGRVYRFGGINHQGNNLIFLNETWILKPMKEIFLPIVSK